MSDTQVVQSINQPAASASAGPELQAEMNWQRWEYAKTRGHKLYVDKAAKLEGVYFGDRQWDPEHVRQINGARPTYTFNEVKPGVDSAIGYQIHNRLDIQYFPAGGDSDQARATLRSKIAMQILKGEHYQWKETQVFGDGCIEQRGYFDIRMCFDDNIYGDVSIETLDPRDVAPDPDAKTYDPKGWGDVTITRWYTLDQIEQLYGKEARDRASQYVDEAGDWGTFDEVGQRNKFGTEENNQLWDAYMGNALAGLRRYRIVERQYWVYNMIDVLVFPTGDVEPAANITPEALQDLQTQKGAMLQRRRQKQVRWVVSTRWCVLHDAISPYDRFTIIPYFCYFRRGKTLGKVDNAVSPQEAYNKAISQFIHIVNTTANSGWIVYQNSLVNMDVEALKNEGSTTGLVLEVKEGAMKPEKIAPNPIPTGVDRIIELAYRGIKNSTTPDAMRGTPGQEVSGVAIQSTQFASQQELALPLDNLSITRHMVAEMLEYLMTSFMDNERVYRITETDPRTGKPVDNTYVINQYDPATALFRNDITEGKYDVVAADVPIAITFENSQFQQTIELKKAGINVPDRFAIKHSALADKADIIEAMDNAGPPPMSELDTATADLKRAQARMAMAQADNVQATGANTRVTSLYAAVQAGKEIVLNPGITPIADAIARSAGVQDQDQPPLITGPAAPPPGQLALPAPAPQRGAGLTDAFRSNPHTNPNSPMPPVSPDQGVTGGIEGGRQPLLQGA